ncbi:MAG: hypothetical protein HC831_22300 [Chloroflexia bacterium]|nr:hypothetical protein [Chloroflexia bacterium]
MLKCNGYFGHGHNINTIYYLAKKTKTMPQSLVKNYIHITFSTKNRMPLIQDFIKDELFNYLGGTCKELESQPVIVGGVSDHVHLLINLSRKNRAFNIFFENFTLRFQLSK